MIICEVLQGSRRYVFASKCRLKKGTYVMCDTKLGDQPGVVVECFEVNDTDSVLFMRYLALMGATEPLKEIIGVFVPFKWLKAWAKEQK